MEHYTVFLLFLVVDGSVTVTTKFEGNKVGPCMKEVIVVRCSVVGTTLRWTITDSFFVINGTNTVTLSANPSDEGRYFVVRTSRTNLEFYQNGTVQNLTHPSSSTIEAEVHFQLVAENDFVAVSCASSMATQERNITLLGT